MIKGTIIYVGGFELPDKNAAAHRVLSNAKAFKKLGYDIVFLDVDKSLNHNMPIKRTKKVVQNFDCWSISYPNNKKQWIKYLCDIKSVKGIINEYNNVKMVICYNYQALALFKLKRYCKKNSIKILADCTEWYSARGKGAVFGIIKGLDSFFRMRIIQKRLDGLIVISRYLENYYKRCKNVICVPPLVDIQEDKWKKNTKQDNEYLTLVYAGSPSKNKDRLDVLIESISRIKNKHVLLNIVGITKEQYLSDYSNRRNILETDNNRIHFLGRLNHLATLQYIKSADFSIFFRDNNRVSRAGFPTKLVESISCGVPVITNITGDIREYLTDKHDCLIMNKDFENINIICRDNVNSKKFDYNNYLSSFELYVRFSEE